MPRKPSTTVIVEENEIIEPLDGDVVEFINDVNSQDVIEKDTFSFSDLRDVPVVMDGGVYIDEKQKEIEEFNDELFENLKTDYRNSRKTLQKMLESISEPFYTSVQEAVVSGDPKMVTALSSLLGNITNATIKLTEMSNKLRNELPIPMEEIKEESKKDDVKNQTNVQNNYFYGTTESLISELKESKE